MERTITDAFAIVKHASVGSPEREAHFASCGRGDAALMTDTTPRESLDEQLKSAIASKRLIQFRYDDRVRVAEPHDYGVQKGATRLLVYQLWEPGVRYRTGVRGWRLLELAKISECVILARTFRGTRGDSRQHHYQWDVLYARVT
jgi:hypothetical protein